MRIATILTAGEGAALSVSTLCWALGAGPHTILLLHTAMALVATTLLYVAAHLNGATQNDALWSGGFAGFIGAASSQFLIHTSAVTAPLSTAFINYGPVEAFIYRMDTLSPWWPYAWILWSTAIYALWGAVVWQWSRRRLKIAAS